MKKLLLEQVKLATGVVIGMLMIPSIFLNRPTRKKNNFWLHASLL
jgi:hypothetical protein